MCIISDMMEMCNHKKVGLALQAPVVELMSKSCWDYVGIYASMSSFLHIRIGNLTNLGGNRIVCKQILCGNSDIYSTWLFPC